MVHRPLASEIELMLCRASLQPHRVVLLSSAPVRSLAHSVDHLGCALACVCAFFCLRVKNITQMNARLRGYQADVEKFKRDLAAAAAGPGGGGAQANRDQLFGSGTYADQSVDQRSRLLDNETRLDRTSQRILNSQRIGEESGALCSALLCLCGCRGCHHGHGHHLHRRLYMSPLPAPPTECCKNVGGFVGRSVCAKPHLRCFTARLGVTLPRLARTA